jgi:predicted acylesterase/phospholipase RssA
MGSTIKHIVISGGGGSGLAFYGVARESNKAGFWKMSDIETMHATSVGTLLMMSLPIINVIGWDAYDDFAIKRPWEKIFDVKAERLLHAYTNVGIFDRETIEFGIQPLLASVDLSLNTTLQEFYEFSGVEMHWYTTNLDNYCLEDVSYKTHPTWTLMDAAYCSVALPIMFRPGNVNGVFYNDGGTFCNYPIMKCVALTENPDEIFGICKNNDEQTRGYTRHVEYENLFDYLADIVLKTVDCLERDTKIPIRNVVCVKDTNTTISEVMESFKTPESRSAKIQKGVLAWREFFASIGGSVH